MKYAVSGIFFDFSGTLFEIYPSTSVIWSRIAKKLGFDISPDDPKILSGMKNLEIAFLELQKPYSALSDDDLFSLCFNVLDSIGIKHEGTREVIRGEFRRRREGYKIFPDCKETLELIHSKGIKIGLISNCIPERGKNRRPTMKENGILHFFEAIILSSEVGFQKPQIEIFNLALNTIGIKDRSNVMHIGDSMLTDVKGAKNAGLIPVHFDLLSIPTKNKVIRIRKLSEILNYIL